MFKPHFWLRLLLLAALLGTTPARALDFVALGDMPYGDSPAIEATYHRLIARINATRPAFSVHVGDFKSGGTECSDAAFVRQRDNFGRFDHPLVYTPGDNEWTDCHRRSNGAYVPIERLARVRQLFFGQQDHAAGRMQNILHRGQHFCCRAHYHCIELIPIIVSLAFILMNMSQVRPLQH
jgi:hypothetical protein